MATIIATDVTVHFPIGAYERKVIEANRKLAEFKIMPMCLRPVRPVRGGQQRPNDIDRHHGKRS